MRSIRSIAVALALTFLFAGRSDGARDERALTGYAVTSWTDADGLPFGGVHVIVQDSDGYLWVGTNAGLLRFDGMRFTPWNSIGNEPLPNSPVLALCIDHDGGLWAGLANGGVYQIHNRQSIRRDAEEPLEGSISAITEDHHGTIWAVAGTKLVRFRSSRWEQVSIGASRVAPIVVSVAVRRNGDVLAGTRAALFGSRDGLGPFEPLAPGWAWATSEDANDRLWVTDQVAGFRPVEEQRRPHPGFERNGYRLLHDRFGNIWLATSQELLRVVTDTKLDPVIERATLQAGLLNDSVLSLFEDREGNIWAGSTVGLHRITRQKLTPMANVGLIVTATAEKDGLWVGTNYGVVRASISEGAWHVTRVPAPPMFVRSFWREGDDRLWIGANEGLFRLSEGRLTRSVSAEMLGGPVVSIIPDANGQLWLADGRRVVHWDGKRLAPLRLPHGEESRQIVLVYRDHLERLWMAFADGTAGFLTRDGSFRDFPSEVFGSARTAIHSIIEDRHRTATWFGTSHGISRLEGEHITTLGSAQGLPGSRVWTITEDDDGYLWANTDLGVIRFSPQEFVRATTDTTHRFQYHFYDPADGLSGGPIVSVQSGRTSYGQLWFLRGGSLSVVEPASLSRFPPGSPESLRIEMAFADGQRVNTEAGVRLPPRVKRIDINYSAIALTYPNRIRFRHRLEGFDTSWTDAGTRRTASYTNLPPRKYVFHIEAETDDGLWRATAPPWTFVIRPAFYETWWFFGTFALAAGVGIGAAWRFRLQLDRRRHTMVLAERMRLSREIHDTLLQSMVGVSLQLEDLALEPDRPLDQLRRRLLAIRRQVEGCMRDARRSIQNLRSPLLERKDLVGAIREAGATATSGTSVDFSVSTTGDSRRYPSHIEYEILRIAQEAIINAVRHAHASRIEVLLRFDADCIALEVKDDGSGPSHPEHDSETHFGVASMTERAESLGGRFTLGLSSPSGTRIEAIIPIPLQS